MKFDKQTKQVINLLKNWSKGKHHYDFFHTHDIEYFQNPEPMEDLEYWFGFDFTKHVNDKFYAFAIDGTGGAFCLWDFDGRIGEMPVVMIGSEGETTNLASNILDYAARFCYPGFAEWQYEDLLSLSDEIDSLDEMKRLLQLDIEEFTERFKQKFELKNFEKIKEENAAIPNFERRIEEIRALGPDRTLENKDDSYLDLSNQELTEIPTSILDNLEIRSLNLSGNKITVIPEFITQLKNLNELDLSNNKVSELPACISKLSQLHILELQNNKFSKLNIDFSEFENLEYLYIQNNEIELLDIDASLFECQSLRVFSYDETPIAASHSELEIMERFQSPYILEDIEEVEIDENTSDEDFVLIEKIHNKRCKLHPAARSYYHFAKYYQFEIKANFEKAVELYQKTLEYQEEADFEGETYTSFAKLYWLTMGTNFAQAKKYLEKGIELEPQSMYALNVYILFLETDDTADDKEVVLEKMYKKRIKLDPINDEYVDSLGTLMIDQERYAKAIKIYKKALKINKSENNFSNYFHALSMADADEKVIDKAYAKAIKRYPNSEMLKTDYAEHKSSIGESSLLDNQLKKKLEDEPEDIDALIRLLNLKVESKKFEVAKTICDKIISLEPDHVKANSRLAFILDQLDAPFEKIDNQFQKIIELIPENGRMHFTYMKWLIKKNASDEKIIAVGEKVIALKSDKDCVKMTKQVLKIRKVNMTDLSEFDKAIAACKGDVNVLLSKMAGNTNIREVTAYLNAAEKIAPYNSTILISKAMMLTARGNVFTGIDYLENKCKAAPNNMDTHKALTQFYLKTTQFEKAVISLQKALTIFPDDEVLTDWLQKIEDALKAEEN